MSFTRVLPGLFFLLALLAWLKPLLTGRALFYDVLFKLFYPNQEYLRRCLLSGSWPLWNPHLYSGVPFMANLQSALLYPSTYLGLVLDFSWWAWANTWLHTALAGVFMYVFARALGLSAAAAALSGVAFSLNGNFLLRYPFPSNIQSYVWLPLILIAGFKKDLSLRRAWLLGAAAMALQFFGGHPQYLLYSLLACALCAALGPGRNRWLAVLCGCGLIFLALTAVQLTAALRLVLDSVRASGLGREWALAYSIQPRELLLMLAVPQWNAFFTPKSGDPHVVGFYFGPLLLLCAGLAFRLERRRWLVFAALSLTGLLFSLGKHFPLYPWLYEYLPPFRSFRFPCQAVYLACFGLSVLAGLGLETLPSRWKKILPALVVADLLLFGWRSTVTADPVVFRASPPLAAWLQENAGDSRVLLAPRTRYSLRVRGETETEAWLRFKNILFPNFPLAYGLYAADGHEELRLARYEKILDSIDQDPLSPWIDVFGVKYVLTLGTLPPKFRLVASGLPNVFLNPAAFPKAYLASGAVYVPDEDALEYVARRGSAFLRELIVVSKPRLAEPAQCRAAGKARVLEYGPQSVGLAVESSCPAWLVLTDAYDSNWRASVNDISTPVERVNVMQRGVRVPQGRSSVVFSYPLPLWPAAVSLITWLFVLILLFGKRIGQIIAVRLKLWRTPPGGS